MTNRIGRILVATAATLILTATSTAQAEASVGAESPEFGAQGQLVFADLLGVSLGSAGIMSPTAILVTPTGWISVWRAAGEETSNGVDYTTNNTFMSVAPSVDYFVMDRVSIGGMVAGAYASREMNTSELDGFDASIKEYYVSVTPRVGVTWPLSDELTLWTRLGVGHERSQLALPDRKENSSSWRADAEFQLVVQASRHLLFAVGPALTLRSYKDEDDATGATIRDFSMMGGYMKGTIGLVL